MRQSNTFVDVAELLPNYSISSYGEREEWNQQVGLHEKWQVLAEIWPVVEGSKWTYVGD